MNEWTIIRDIQLCPEKPTATAATAAAAAAAAAAAENPTFDCVPCNKSFPKIHFLLVLSICLPQIALVSFFFDCDSLPI